jgi:hypothetical protein
VQKLVAIVVDVAIITIVCLSLFSGKPAFKTSAAAYDTAEWSLAV